MEYELAAQCSNYQQLLIMKKRLAMEKVGGTILLVLSVLYCKVGLGRVSSWPPQVNPPTCEGLTRSERLLWYRNNQEAVQVLIPVTCHLSPVTCHLQPVTCHLPPVTCHLSPRSLTRSARRSRATTGSWSWPAVYAAPRRRPWRSAPPGTEGNTGKHCHILQS